MVRKAVLVLVGTLLLVMATAGIRPTGAQAAVSDWQRGAAIIPTSSTDFSSGSFQQSLRNLAATHATYVALVIPYFQTNIYTTDVQPGGTTPTDDSLRQAINYAHSLGLKVMLKPHIDPYDGQWRASINPADRDTWFAKYGDMLNHYADIAQSTGAEQICLGTELIAMTLPSSNPTNTQHWLTMIAGVRSHFSGKLTYSAQGSQPEEKSQLEFWPELDYIGLSAYYPLSTNSSTDVAGLESAWATVDAQQIRPLVQKYNKQVLFTEVGFRSVSGARYAPWDYAVGGPADQAEQASLYQAMFEYWNGVPYMAGVDLWDWNSNPGAGGNGNTDYTPQNKQAQAVMTSWFGGSGGAINPPTGPVSFATQVSVPSAPATGQAAQLGVTVTNSGSGSASGVLTDLEVYDSHGQKVFQQAFPDGSYAGGASKAYAAAWTPQSAGSYVVKVGVFSNDWSKLYMWNDGAAQFTVGSVKNPPLDPNPSSGSINAWWPSNGTPVSGTQPFKAQLSGVDSSQYTMYWQVDGDQLNAMSDSNQDAPHKESLVDVSSWNWRGSGPYTITFVAKNGQGAVIAQTSVQITVNH